MYPIVIIWYILYKYADGNSVSNSSEDVNVVAPCVERDVKHIMIWFETNLLSTDLYTFEYLAHSPVNDKLRLTIFKI